MIFSFYQSVVLLSLITCFFIIDAYFCFNENALSNKYFKLHLRALSLNKKVANDERHFRIQSGFGSIRLSIAFCMMIIAMFSVKYLGFDYRIIYLFFLFQIIIIIYNQVKLSETIKPNNKPFE